MSDKINISYARHIRDTLKLAWPVITGQLGHIIIGQADTLMIGKLGSSELAAATLANSMFFLVVVLGFGLCAAISPITSQAIGAEKSEQHKNEILGQGLKAAFILSLIFIGVLLIVITLVPYFGQDRDVAVMAMEYLGIIAFSSVPMMLFLAYKHFIEGYEFVKPGMVIMWITVVFNVFFNWLLIYGKWGLPELGLNGAGWSTLISRTLGLVIIIMFMKMSPAFRRMNLFPALFRKSKEVMRQILRIGLPSGMQYFFEIGAFSGAVILAGRIGKDQQSAHGIAILIAALTYMFYMGISSASSIRVGNAFGRKDEEFIRRAGHAGLITSAFFILVFIILLWSLKNVIPELYIDDPSVTEIAVGLLQIAALFQVFDGLQAVGQGILRGIEDVRLPTVFAFCAYWIIGLPLSWLMAEIWGFGINGIWYALTIGLAFSAILLVSRFFMISSKLKFKG